MKQKLLYNLFDYDRAETPGEIVFYRVFELFVVCWAVYFAWDWGTYLARLKEVVHPLGIAEYVDVSFMFKHNLGVVNAATITVMLAAGFWRWSRMAYLASLLLLHLHYVARYSQGKVAHGSNLIGMAILALAIATLAFQHQKEIRRTALGLFYFFFGLGYTSAALCKLVGTGLGWPAGRHLHMWIRERTVDTLSMTGSIDYNWLQELALKSGFVATAILTFGLVVEMSAFLMWYKRTRPIIMLSLAGMHVGIIVVMNVSFTANLYLLLLLGVSWPILIDRTIDRLDTPMIDVIRRSSIRWA